jgi:hypothetical protein
LDVFAAHRTQAVKELFQAHNIEVIYVPASCTGELQPLDVSGNASFKSYLKESFSTWYADKVAEQEQVQKVNLTMTHLKPIHANWLVSAWSQLKAKPELSITGWRKTGLSEAIGWQ